MEDRIPQLHVFPHESGDSGADLVDFEALYDASVGHTIEGLLVVDPGRGEIKALVSHLLKDGFVDEELIFAPIAPAEAYIHTYIHTLLARPHGAFQSQFYITKL